MDVNDIGSEAVGITLDRSFETQDDYTIYETSGGITLRQHYAGLAMQGYIAAGSTGMPTPEAIARLAAATADALLAELS